MKKSVDDKASSSLTQEELLLYWMRYNKNTFSNPRDDPKTRFQKKYLEKNSPYRQPQIKPIVINLDIESKIKYNKKKVIRPVSPTEYQRLMVKTHVSQKEEIGPGEDFIVRWPEVKQLEKGELPKLKTLDESLYEVVPKGAPTRWMEDDDAVQRKIDCYRDEALATSPKSYKKFGPPRPRSNYKINSPKSASSRPVTAQSRSSNSLSRVASVTDDEFGYNDQFDSFEVEQEAIAKIQGALIQATSRFTDGSSERSPKHCASDRFVSNSPMASSLIKSPSKSSNQLFRSQSSDYSGRKVAPLPVRFKDEVKSDFRRKSSDQAQETDKRRLNGRSECDYG